jgi:hypothetical protein
MRSDDDDDDNAQHLTIVVLLPPAKQAYLQSSSCAAKFSHKCLNTATHLARLLLLSRPLAGGHPCPHSQWLSGQSTGELRNSRHETSSKQSAISARKGPC